MITLAPTPVAALPADAASPLRFVDVVHAEWTKLRTVRSSWLALLTMLAGAVAIGVIVCAAQAANWDSMSVAARANFDAPFVSLTGLFIGQVAGGVLGVLAITSEYASGMIRTTFAAVHGRRQVLAAKALAVLGATLVVALLSSLVAFLAGQAILSGKGAGVSITDATAVRAVMGGGLYITALALLGLGLGAIVRHSAGAIMAFIGLVLVLPMVVAPLPNPWGRQIAQWLPANAGQAVVSSRHAAGIVELHPWAGFAVVVAWAAAALGLGAWLLTRRDA
jgi:ABC-type transport system involved in multi-copper enzyme maturation permease subunit